MEITEDYVSFETAKLLKEKGFIGSDEIGCNCGFYSEYPDDFEVGRGIKTVSGQEVGLVYDGLDNTQLRTGEYLRPTLQTAMKWLREEKNLYIYIEPVELCLSEGKILTDNEDIRSATELELQLGFRYNIINSNNYSEDDVLSGSYIGDFIKYEDAVEAAIMYCLTYHV